MARRVFVTKSDAARAFSDLLNRVRYRNDQVEIMGSREPVAVLVPAVRPVTARELECVLMRHPRQLDFAEDLDCIQGEQPIPEDPWEP